MRADNLEMVRHTHQNAPSDAEFQRLLEATTRLDYPYSIECRWILFAGGRLGMRAGEIAHMRETWINWDRKQINIPAHESCHKGRGGDVCGYCRQQAAREARNRDISYEEALAGRWHPKTSQSVRAIPFDFEEQTENMVRAFWADRVEFPRSRTSINRRIDRLLDAAEMPQDSTFPHALRAAAATYHAYRGVPAVALQSMFGWARLTTATKYIRLSGGATAKALREAHQP